MPLASPFGAKPHPENVMGRLLKSAVVVVALGFLAGTILRSQMQR
jgi:hypothetical protein